MWLGVSNRSITPQVISGFSTNFPNVQSPLTSTQFKLGSTDGLDWIDPEVTSAGRCVSSLTLEEKNNGRYADCVAVLKSSSFANTANCWVEGTVYKAVGYTGNGGNHEIELHLRNTLTPHFCTTYEVLWGITGYLAVVKWNGTYDSVNGNFTAILDPGLGSMPTPNDGDVLRAEISGTIITVKLNGSIVSGFSAVDVGSDYSSGQCGLGFWPVDGGIKGSMGWASWRTGNL